MAAAERKAAGARGNEQPALSQSIKLRNHKTDAKTRASAICTTGSHRAPTARAMSARLNGDRLAKVLREIAGNRTGSGRHKRRPPVATVTGADLCHEWRTTAALSAGYRDELVELGVARRDIELLIGIAHVRLCRGDLYEPDPDGRRLLITPARVHTELSPESSIPDAFCRAGPIIDLIAWHPTDPENWALRTGAAEWLGCIEPQYLKPDPVPIRRSPLSWFQAGCVGLMLLSRSRADQYRILSGLGGIIAEDATHSSELRRIFQRPFSAPRIWDKAKDRSAGGVPENAPGPMLANIAEAE